MRVGLVILVIAAVIFAIVVLYSINRTANELHKTRREREFTVDTLPPQYYDTLPPDYYDLDDEDDSSNRLVEYEHERATFRTLYEVIRNIVGS